MAVTSSSNLFGRTPLSRRRALWGLALVAPNTLGLLFFFGIPVLLSFYTLAAKVERNQAAGVYRAEQLPAPAERP